MSADVVTILLELPSFKVTQQANEPDSFVFGIEPTACEATVEHRCNTITHAFLIHS
jgi:hypothetical protein